MKSDNDLACTSSVVAAGSEELLVFLSAGGVNSRDRHECSPKSGVETLANIETQESETHS